MTAHGYPQAGETIGGYRVGRRLGGGGMGVVYEALDEGLHRSVALKVIAPNLAEDAAQREEFQARFTREARAQASLDSPHVVQVYAHGEDEGRLWIASQLIPDGDLREMLNKLGAPPLTTALDIMEQVASGLAAAHEVGLVHRDIKPANVLLRRREARFHAYLADFGIARRVDGEQTHIASSATVGTPSYMAPELHTGGMAGAASDVYSLGCLLWATLTGRAPYAGTSDFEIVTAHREQPVPQLPEGRAPTAAINDLLRRTMAKVPADRPGSAAEVRDELRRLREVAIRNLAPSSSPSGTPPPPPPAASPGSPAPVTPGPDPGGPPPGRRRGALVVALVAVVVLAAAALGYALTRDDDEASADDPRPSPSSSSAPAEPSPTAASTATAAPPTSPAPTNPIPGSPSAATTYSPEQAERAAEAMAQAFEGQPGVTPTQARCVADQTIAQIGLERLVEIGLFDADLRFVDTDLAPYPEVKDVLSAAVLTCAQTP